MKWILEYNKQNLAQSKTFSAIETLNMNSFKINNIFYKLFSNFSFKIKRIIVKKTQLLNVTIMFPFIIQNSKKKIKTILRWIWAT